MFLQKFANNLWFLPFLLGQLKALHEVFEFFIASYGGAKSCHNLAFCYPHWSSQWWFHSVFGRRWQRLAIVPSIELTSIFKQLNELFHNSVTELDNFGYFGSVTAATPCPDEDAITSFPQFSVFQEQCPNS